MDRITLHRIVAHGRHGADPGERDQAQPFHIDLSMDLDLSRPAQSDDLEDTIDYAKIYGRVLEIVEQRSYALIERLGADLVDVLMADHRVGRCYVTIAKPQILDGATPSVTLVRERK